MPNSGFHSSDLDNKELKAQIVRREDDVGETKPIYSAIIKFRLYEVQKTQTKERFGEISITYKQRYHNIQEDEYLIGRIKKREKAGKNEECEILDITLVSYLGRESYSEPVIGEPLEKGEVAIIIRKDFPCTDHKKKGKLEELHDTYNTKICSECGDIISFERVEGKKAQAKRVVNKNRKNDLFAGDPLTSEEIINLNEKPVELKLPPLPKQKKRGGVKTNFVYNEKCEATMDRMKDNAVDYVFTSPPYNIGKAIGGNKYQGKNFSDEMTQQQYFDWQVEVIEELLRVTKYHVFYNVQMLTDNKVSIFLLQEHFKYRIKDIFIWRKSKAAPASTKGVTNSHWEYIFAFSNKEPLMRNFKDGNFHGNFSNVIEVHHDSNKYAKKHKAVFPVDLPRTFVLKFGKEGDIWYDPFGGSGTTAVAAIREGRKWILSEMSEEYCNDIIAPRLQNESGGTIKMNL